MIVPLDSTVPLGILEIVTLVPFSVDKMEAKLSKLLSRSGFNMAPNLKVLPNALFPLDTNPPACAKELFPALNPPLTRTLTYIKSSASTIYPLLLIMPIFVFGVTSCVSWP